MESENLYDADELGQYQSLSTAAIVALMLGLLSPLAFFSPLLVVVPLFALAVALWALARIKGSEGGLLGTRLAYCGLALAIVFGVASVTRVQIRGELLQRQASEAAQRWLSLLAQGRAEEVLSLMTHAATAKLSPSGEDGGPVPVATVPIFEAELRSAQLLRDPLAVALSGADQSRKEPLFKSVGNQVHDSPKPRAVLYFQFPNQDSFFLLSLVKTGRSPAVWLVEAWETEEVTVP